MRVVVAPRPPPFASHARHPMLSSSQLRKRRQLAVGDKVARAASGQQFVRTPLDGNLEIVDAN